MAKNKINFFKIDINGDTWNIYKISETDTVTFENEDSAAEIDTENKEIHFKTTTLKDIKHECWHLFKHYTFTHSANLDALQEEEVSAELFAHKSEKIDEIAKIIYEKLKQIEV